MVAWDWSTGIPMDALASPQVSVNRRLPVPEACDVFVGIFRCRFGTPLPLTEFRREDGSCFQSGSEYEFDRAWKARRRGAPLPEILVYRQDDSVASAEADAVQRDLLKTFFDSAPFVSEAVPTGSVNRFVDAADFEYKLDGHLRTLLAAWHPDRRLPLDVWLERHARRTEQDAGPRYTREAHLESEIARVFDWLLARPRAIADLDDALAEVWKQLDAPAFALAKAGLRRISEAMRADPHWLSSPPDFDGITTLLKQIQELGWAEHEAVTAQGSKATAGRHSTLQAVGPAQEAIRLIDGYALFARKRVLLLTGPAGQGKTHTLVHEVRRTLDAGGVAVAALGQTLSAQGDLRTALATIWELRDGFAAFLDRLDAVAAQRGERALIVIDALNETSNRHRWKNELAGIVHEVLERPHLTLALGVRSDYFRQVVPELGSGRAPPWVEHRHSGFSDVGADALLAYCAHYGVAAPVAPPVGELGNPLYVQLLVKSLQGRPAPTHWLPSWLEVWAAWVERLEEDARSRFQLDPSRPNPVRRCLNKLALGMLRSGHFRLPRDEADNIARSVAGIEGLVGFLCSSGALMDRLEDDDDIVEFGFERLSDTYFADRLLHQLFEGKDTTSARREALVRALSPTGLLRGLMQPGRRDDPLGVRRSGLLAAMCLAVPLQAGVELPELMPAYFPDESGWPWPDLALKEAFTDSLRWRHRPEEFAGSRSRLWRLYRRRGEHHGELSAWLDELIRLALIPGHPFAMADGLHPRLLKADSPGARDAWWSIELVALWRNEGSTLCVLVRWASESALSGLHLNLAVPVAQLLAWTCAVSQQALREQATRGLTRVLVACPDALAVVLADFLAVNDDYVVESVLVATWGVLIDGSQSAACSDAARQVWEVFFAGGSPRCHLTVRHYARRIVEAACERGWLDDVDPTRVRPPYRSELPLDQVPSEAALRATDTSIGFREILGSALAHDFYWYVMGATSGGKPFSSRPLPHSNEPERRFGKTHQADVSRRPAGIFDIPLAARFVAWNCHRLGWTGERFEGFDTGPEVRDAHRIVRPGRTERIGKKYQWIGWQTMLAFLADNYQMTSASHDDVPQEYDTPHQIGYIEVLDPSRWLQRSPRLCAETQQSDFWRIPSQPRWPGVGDEAVRNWGSNPMFDLPVSDVITHVPALLSEWGEGPWLRIAADHAWSSPACPGMWGLDVKQAADVWWQVTPALIKKADLPVLLEKLKLRTVQHKLEGQGRIDLAGEWDKQLAEWPGLAGPFDCGIQAGNHSRFDSWLPVPWMFLAGECGHPDRKDEHGPVLMPWPRLFRDWGLKLDLQHGAVRHGDTVVFGLAGCVLGEEALFARRDPLMGLLADSGRSLVWWLHGERRASVRGFGCSDARSRVWIDSSGVAYLGQDGRVQIAWLSRSVRT